MRPNATALCKLTRLQTRNQFGAPGGGEEFSESGANFLNYVQYFQTMPNIFFQGVKEILRKSFAPSWLQVCLTLTRKWLEKVDPDILLLFIRPNVLFWVFPSEQWCGLVIYAESHVESSRKRKLFKSESSKNFSRLAIAANAANSSSQIYCPKMISNIAQRDEVYYPAWIDLRKFR